MEEIFDEIYTYSREDLDKDFTQAKKKNEALHRRAWRRLKKMCSLNG